MKVIRRSIGISDKYHKGKCVYIDFRDTDNIIIWIEYKKCCKAYHVLQYLTKGNTMKTKKSKELKRCKSCPKINCPARSPSITGCHYVPNYEEKPRQN